MDNTVISKINTSSALPAISSSTLSNFSTSTPISSQNNSNKLWSLYFIFLLFFFGYAIWYLYNYYNIAPINNENVNIPLPNHKKDDAYKLDDETSIINEENNNKLKNAINEPNMNNNTPIADDSYSSIQHSFPSNKSGWCFIGEERGIRSCIEVGDNDKCMSGNIFPSQEICINPSLRL